MRVCHLVPSLSRWSFQIVPPYEIEQKPLRGTFVLNRCIKQKFDRENGGTYSINFDNESRMTLQTFKEAANEFNSFEKLDSTDIENLFWANVKGDDLPGSKQPASPIYAIDA